MASSDVDQKYLGRIAAITAETNPLVSQSLFQILGLSVVLSRKLFRARKLRKLDTSRDTKSLELYHHIVWLSREGLSILEVCVLPYTQGGELGPECQVLASKLRASFYHIFCLFHNNPPITSASSQGHSGTQTPTPLSPKDDNGRRRTRSGSGGSQVEKRDSTPKRSSRDSKGKKPLLRDPIDSITSDASFLTNPYAGVQPGATPPPGLAPQVAGLTPQLPPGLAPIPPKPSAFLLPAINFIPLTSAHFRAATTTGASILAGAHPLRLSVAIEHAAFLWDCVHDHDGARQLARRAIRDLRQGEEEGVTDEGFEDAAEMVGILGRIMRRKSWEGTPGIGGQTSPAPATTTSTTGPSTMPATVPITTAPPSAPPTAPIPTTPRRINVLRDPANPTNLDGGPMGGTPTTPSSHRRDSKSSSSQAHKRSGSRSTTTQANTPRERTRVSGETPPRTRHSSGGNTGVTPPCGGPLKEVETPPRPPPKDYDYPRTTPSTTRIPSKQNTPSARVHDKATTPTSKPASQIKASPLRERTTPSTQPSTYRRSSEPTSPLRLEQYHVDEPAVINGFYDDDGRTSQRGR
ncbi:hypothetical protein EJ08DRAFT_322760 [Tothia fuscella]|uniref:14-3-3 domain-containing protein n=1 Tax=Tothia fuscella TaxID=1048955 RepID=A0A9P4NMS0_9PEZI|nr:hypothetical protein EJ08DRAFT_322760 [Tothia fuscella]